VPKQGLEVSQPSECMKNATVSPIDLGRLHQPVTGIAAPRRQGTDQKQALEQIEIAPDGFAIKTE